MSWLSIPWLLVGAASAGVEPLSALEACAATGGRVELGPEAGQESVTRIALVIGVQCYEAEGLRKIRFAHDDARLMSSVLEQSGFTVIRLTGDVKRETLLDELSAVQRRVKAGGEIVIYYAGHGALARADQQLERYLLPADATASTVSTVGVSVADLERSLSASPAAFRTLILDTCYAGDGGRSASLDDVPLGRGLQLSTLPRSESGDMWLYASDIYQTAREYTELGGGHGAYTWFLTQGLETASADLDHDGENSFLEAHFWAINEVIQITQGLQTPQSNIGSGAPPALNQQNEASAPRSGVLIIPPQSPDFWVFIDELDTSGAPLGRPTHETAMSVEPRVYTVRVCWTGGGRIPGAAPCPSGVGALVNQARVEVEVGSWEALQPLLDQSRSFVVLASRTSFTLLGTMTTMSPTPELSASPTLLGVQGSWMRRQSGLNAHSWVVGLSKSDGSTTDAELSTPTFWYVYTSLGLLRALDNQRQSLRLGPTLGTYAQLQKVDETYIPAFSGSVGLRTLVRANPPTKSYSLAFIVEPELMIYLSYLDHQPLHTHPTLRIGVGLTL